MQKNEVLPLRGKTKNVYHATNIFAPMEHGVLILYQ